MIVGKGLYEGILQEVRLAPFFAKAVLGIPRTLDDLPGLDPALHRSLIQVLRYDGVPPFPETEQYVERVLTRAERIEL